MLKPLVILISCACSITGCLSNEPSHQLPIIRQDRFVSEPFPVKRVNRTKFADKFLPTTVRPAGGYDPGTIVVDTSQKLLYHIQQNGMARRYGIAVGATGYAWYGSTTIGRKAR